MGGSALIYDDEEFLTLRRKWYAKLRSIGFEDAESVRPNQSFLKQYHSNYFFRHHTPEDIELTESYYRRCRDFFWNYSFKTKQEKALWHFHCEGRSVREIMKETRQTFYKTQKMIAALKKIMQSDTWSSSEGTGSDRET